MYSKRKVVVLDDVFSGMDAHTAHHVSTSLLGPNGLLRRNLASVVVATHSRKFSRIDSSRLPALSLTFLFNFPDKIMALADTIISLEDGRIIEVGSPATLSQGHGYVSRLGLVIATSDVATNSLDADDDARHAGEQPVKQLSADQPIHTDIRRKNGEMSVYKYYLGSAGWKAVTLYTISVVMWIFFTEFSSRSLKCSTTDCFHVDFYLFSFPFQPSGSSGGLRQMPQTQTEAWDTTWASMPRSVSWEPWALLWRPGLLFSTSFPTRPCICTLISSGRLSRKSHSELLL